MDSNMKNEDFLYKAGNDLSDHEMDLDALDYGLDEPTFAELAQNEKISADANEIENRNDTIALYRHVDNL